MPPDEPIEGFADTPQGRVTFRVYRDGLGNLVVPRGATVTLADGTVVGVTAEAQALPRGRAHLSMGATSGRWGVISTGMVMRTSQVGMFAAMTIRTVALGEDIPPYVPAPQRWVPLTVESGRKGILRLLRERMRTIPKSAFERLLDDEELA